MHDKLNNEAPYKYQSVDHIREGYRRSVYGVGSIYLTGFLMKNPNFYQTHLSPNFCDFDVFSSFFAS
jgi:hypothetical protein